MSVPEAWIPHRREDGELVGWIVPEGEGFVTIDLLGRSRSAEPLDWVAADLPRYRMGFPADDSLRLLADAPGPVRGQFS